MITTIKMSNNERVLAEGEWFHLINRSTFETLAGQFQKLTDKIIVVKDGTELLCFSDTNSIPPYLKPESINTIQLTGVDEFYYRSVADDSLYTFFDKNIDIWLRGPKNQIMSLQRNKKLSELIICDRPMGNEMSKAENKLSASYTVPTLWSNKATQTVPPPQVEITHESFSLESSLSDDDGELFTGMVININTGKNPDLTREVIELS